MSRFPRLHTSAVALVLACTATVGSALGQNAPTYKDPKAALEARVDDLFKQLTPEEKLSLLTGTGFGTAAIPRLGVPAMEMADAGQGVRGGTKGTQGPATAFPSGVAMASTWDPELIGRVGKAIGEETRNKGTGAQVLLGPAVNIQRSALNGRNGEYFSEDPYLAGRLAVTYIQGMQSAGVSACVKHYACNNQETDRTTVDVHVGERALREIYLPAFEAAVKEGHVWSVMSSYNQINGYHASANHYTLTDVLRTGWGFDGVVMSDWGGVHAVAETLNAGNDLEMPGGDFLTPKKLEAAMKAGELTQETVDLSVKRILRMIIRTGLADGEMPKPDHAMVDSAEHREVAMRGALEGIVLLKNEGGILPLTDSVKSVALIGQAAKEPQYGAEGSPHVTAVRAVSPYEGIVARAGGKAKVTFAPGSSAGVPVPADVVEGGGWRGEYFDDKGMKGKSLLVRQDAQIQFDWNEVAPGPEVNRDHFAVRWTGAIKAPKSGKYKLSFSGDDGYRVFFGERRVINAWHDQQVLTRSAEVEMEAGKTYPVRIEYYQGGGGAEARLNWTLPGTEMYAEAIAAARASDVAVVFVTTKGAESEGVDRSSMDLPMEQDDVIRAVAAVNRRVVVVLNNGTPVTMTRWLDQAPAVVETWFPGEEGGTALAKILFGDASPSGKLPTTLAKRREDYPDAKDFPGKFRALNYDEGVYVGYRHFDKENIEPLFPFGHGLSYTTFAYANAKVSGETVTVDVTNSGKAEGTEVVQLYVHDTAGKVDRPTRELKGFRRVDLKPGETRTVSFPITPRMLAYFDVAGKGWRADQGAYEFQVGSSSRDIRQKVGYTLASDFREAVPGSAEQRPAFPAEGDVAAHKPTTASSTEKNEYEPENATDGNNDTRWSSKFADGEWLAVDLGAATKVDHVRLKWEAAYASAYEIQTSDDGQAWNTVATKTDGKPGTETVPFPAVSARHVRVLCTKRGTNNGVSLFSFEVFAAR